MVGIDVSAAMTAAARSRAHSAVCRTRFEVGDAVCLDADGRSFDVVRSERTLHWLDEPAAAVSEMARVVCPGGLVSLVDTDWSTFEIDVGDVGGVGDDTLALIVHDAMQTERNRPSHVGRRLAQLARDAGLDPVERTAATHR